MSWPTHQAPVQKVDSAIQWMNNYPVNNAFGSRATNCWIVIYPVNSAIQLLNNWGQASSVKLDSVNWHL